MRHRCIYTEKPFKHTLYYKACTKHFPVLLCTLFFPILYFALQSLQKALPCTTLYYEACTLNGPHPPRTRGIPCIAGRSHFTRKKQGFVLQLPPQHKPHATVTQPLQFFFAATSVHHAAITMRSATADSKTPYSYAHTTKQALQNTIKEPITNQNERTAPAAHTRYLSPPAEATLYRKTRFRAPASSQTKANATLIQPLICVLQQQVYIWLYDVTHTALHECIVM